VDFFEREFDIRRVGGLAPLGAPADSGVFVSGSLMGAQRKTAKTCPRRAKCPDFHVEPCRKKNRDFF
jgi:hypothetical protein